MQHLHKFVPHPEFAALYCERCGEAKEFVAGLGMEARQPAAPRRPRRNTVQVDAVAAAEAELARRMMELPLDEVQSPDLDGMVQQFARQREEQPVPVVDDERLGAGIGL